MLFEKVWPTAAVSVDKLESVGLTKSKLDLGEILTLAEEQD